MNNKKPLKLDEQIKHLKSHKKIIFKDISEEDAKERLYVNNYINLVSPNKWDYCKKDNKNVPLIDKNKQHIYTNDIDFSCYIRRYDFERSKYDRIYHNIRVFESVFNSILSYEIVNYYKLINQQGFSDFTYSLLKNIATYIDSREYSPNEIKNMFHYVLNMNHSYLKYNNIYIFLDRQNLSQIIILFRSIDFQLRRKVFNSLLKRNLTFGYNNFPTFNDFLDRVVSIRNCICHFNSLTILVRYYNIKEKSLRTSSDRKKYLTAINKLIER